MFIVGEELAPPETLPIYVTQMRSIAHPCLFLYGCDEPSDPPHLDTSQKHIQRYW